MGLHVNLASNKHKTGNRKWYYHPKYFPLLALYSIAFSSGPFHWASLSISTSFSYRAALSPPDLGYGHSQLNTYPSTHFFCLFRIKNPTKTTKTKIQIRGERGMRNPTYSNLHFFSPMVYLRRVFCGSPV